MHISRRGFLLTGASTCLIGCASNHQQNAPSQRAILEAFTPEFDTLISPNETLETLDIGYRWAEGPAWDKARSVLYFTDVPSNKAYVWHPEDGVSVFLDPSGAAQTDGFREPGANGLLIGHDQRLLLCNHGRRAIESMDLETGSRDLIVGTYQGRRFNSPNDIVESRNGDLYFTDPPYGLEGLNASALKEMDANGVYHLSPDRQLTRLIADMTFPNGIALSKDEKYLYISQSDPEAPIIRRLNLQTGAQDPVWFDASRYMQDGPGLPDGLAVAASGHILATGPGGVFLLSPEGQALGRINPGRACANCAFGEDGHTLFITAHDRLMRLRLKIQGLSWT